MKSCPNCGYSPDSNHKQSDILLDEPPVGTWVKDAKGVASVHVRHGEWAGWAPAPTGFYPGGQWEAMKEAHGPFTLCGPYGADLLTKKGEHRFHGKTKEVEV